MKRTNDYLWRSLFAVLLGFIMLLWPGLTLSYLVVLAGILLLIFGVIAFADYLGNGGSAGKRFPVLGTVYLLLGIILVATPASFVSTVMILLGLILVLAGGSHLARLITASRDGFRLSWIRYVVPVLLIVVGLVIMFNPFSSASTVSLLLGIALIAYGLSGLIDGRALRKLN